MRMHTLLTKAASIAVCFGIFLSGPVSAFANNKAIMARDVNCQPMELCMVRC